MNTRTLSMVAVLGAALATAQCKSGGNEAESRYAHVEPTLTDVPAALQPQTWTDHLREDILPYWLQDDARGTPVGNFPTERSMTGSVNDNTARRPRMLSRQTFAYSVGYLMTGDPELLRLARAGADWLLDHVPDQASGGYHAVLDDAGAPGAAEPKAAQDTAYVMLGLAAYYFVTRAPDVEAELLRGRNQLFDTDSYWDAENNRIRDGMQADFSAEWDRFGDDGWELVAQLDPVNAFLLLTQPVLSRAEDRATFLADLRTLSETMVREFWQDGVFWGIHNEKGNYGGHHVDFGHTLKAQWMVLQVDKRLQDHPFLDFSADNIRPGLEAAFDAENERWAKRRTSETGIEYGSDWWIYAEADQLAATYALQTGQGDFVAATAAHWLTDYVDARPEGEVIPNIRRDGQPGNNWPPWSTAKCNVWKNGYHSSEHALVMYLVSSYFSQVPAQLYFAVPNADANTFVARPYFFDGDEVQRSVLDDVEVDGTTLTRVRVDFDRLY